MLYIKCKKHESLQGPMIPCLITTQYHPRITPFEKNWVFFTFYEELRLKIMGKNNKLFEIMINNC